MSAGEHKLPDLMKEHCGRTDTKRQKEQPTDECSIVWVLDIRTRSPAIKAERPKGATEPEHGQPRFESQENHTHGLPFCAHQVRASLLHGKKDPIVRRVQPGLWHDDHIVSRCPGFSRSHRERDDGQTRQMQTLPHDGQLHVLMSIADFVDNVLIWRFELCFANQYRMEIGGRDSILVANWRLQRA